MNRLLQADVTKEKEEAVNLTNNPIILYQSTNMKYRCNHQNMKISFSLEQRVRYGAFLPNSVEGITQKIIE